MTKKALRLIAMHNHFKILKQSCFEWLCFSNIILIFSFVFPHILVCKSKSQEEKIWKN